MLSLYHRGFRSELPNVTHGTYDAGYDKLNNIVSPENLGKINSNTGDFNVGELVRYVCNDMRGISKTLSRVKSHISRLTQDDDASKKVSELARELQEHVSKNFHLSNELELEEDRNTRLEGMVLQLRTQLEVVTKAAKQEVLGLNRANKEVQLENKQLHQELLLSSPGTRSRSSAPLSPSSALNNSKGEEWHSNIKGEGRRRESREGEGSRSSESQKQGGGKHRRQGGGSHLGGTSGSWANVDMAELKAELNMDIEMEERNGGEESREYAQDESRGKGKGIGMGMGMGIGYDKNVNACVDSDDEMAERRREETKNKKKHEIEVMRLRKALSDMSKDYNAEVNSTEERLVEMQHLLGVKETHLRLKSKEIDSLWDEMQRMATNKDEELGAANEEIDRLKELTTHKGLTTIHMRNDHPDISDRKTVMMLEMLSSKAIELENTKAHVEALNEELRNKSQLVEVATRRTAQLSELLSAKNNEIASLAEELQSLRTVIVRHQHQQHDPDSRPNPLEKGDGQHVSFCAKGSSYAPVPLYRLSPGLSDLTIEEDCGPNRGPSPNLTGPLIPQSSSAAVYTPTATAANAGSPGRGGSLMIGGGGLCLGLGTAPPQVGGMNPHLVTPASNPPITRPQLPHPHSAPQLGLRSPHSMSMGISSPHTPHSSQLGAVGVGVGVDGLVLDPDQEALDIGLLLSIQEAQYGTNMYESLTSEYEKVVEEYLAMGVDREQAALNIFEERFGKVYLPVDVQEPESPSGGLGQGASGERERERVRTNIYEIENPDCRDNPNRGGKFSWGYEYETDPPLKMATDESNGALHEDEWGQYEHGGGDMRGERDRDRDEAAARDAGLYQTHNSPHHNPYPNNSNMKNIPFGMNSGDYILHSNGYSHRQSDRDSFSRFGNGSDNRKTSNGSNTRGHNRSLSAFASLQMTPPSTSNSTAFPAHLARSSSTNSNLFAPSSPQSNPDHSGRKRMYHTRSAFASIGNKGQGEGHGQGHRQGQGQEDEDRDERDERDDSIKRSDRGFEEREQGIRDIMSRGYSYELAVEIFHRRMSKRF